MDSYLIPISTAFLIFPLLAFAITIPYILYHYRKFGAIPFFRTAVVYSFVLYLLVIYFLVILPLPSIESVAKLKTPTMQLIPFQGIINIIKSFLGVNSIQGILSVLRSSTVYTVLFNLIMFMPLGIYLRYYFRSSWEKTLCLSFLLSLFFELTQLSGLYFIYPRPYRLFDVDDLIVNTLGGMIGFWIEPLFAKILPTMEELDESSYKKGKHVTFLRRAVAFTIDCFISFLLGSIFSFFASSSISSSYLHLSSFALFFVIIPILTKGYTLGKEIVKTKMISWKDETPKWYQYLLKYGTMWFLFSGNFALQSYLSNLSPTLLWYYRVGIGVTVVLQTILEFVFFFQIIRTIFCKNGYLIYERISHLKNISTIAATQGEIENKDEVCYDQKDRGDNHDTEQKRRTRNRRNNKKGRKELL